MSRSGTTLLATILDSHPDVSMGYELLPAGLPGLEASIDLVRAARREAGDGAAACSDWLRDRGHGTLGTFVRRCGRTLVEPSELIAILESFRVEAPADLDTIDMRARLSMAVVEIKASKEGTRCGGFKINGPSVGAFHEVFPHGTFVYIVRDPRDVVASHLANDFDRTIEHIGRAWMQYAGRFLDFRERHPDRALIVRYEDLVGDPGRILPDVLEHLGLEDHPSVREFFRSKASVHAAGHRNSENLRRDFFTTSVARWERDLTLEQVAEIQAACETLMPAFDYALAPVETPEPLPEKIHKRQTAHLARKKRFFRDEYARLVRPHAEGRVNLTWAEAARGERDRDREILILRHDVDHDYETALRMGAWEHAHGLRATYCILHTAWYYGELVGGEMKRSAEMLDCCRRLQALGHEINLHNNFVVVGLQTGLDPVRLLRDELRFMRLHGLDVRGTSTHGDELCRRLDFRNYELFSESVYASRGGPRTVRHGPHSVTLGRVSMHDLGLEYEAYDIPRDLYLTDSGGTLRVRENTRGRAGLRRDEMVHAPPYPRIVGILTHPVWWDFEREAPPGHEGGEGLFDCLTV